MVFSKVIKMTGLKDYGLEILIEHLDKLERCLSLMRKDPRFSEIDCVLDDNFICYLGVCDGPDDILNENNVNIDSSETYNHLKNCKKCYDLGRAILESVSPLKVPKLDEVCYH